MTRIGRGTAVGLLAALGTVASLLTPSQPVAARPSRPPVTAFEATPPTIEWTRCGPQSHVLCAVVEVPLDYDEPSGPTIELDLVKSPALDYENRLGTLFVNPGGPPESIGPGESVADFAYYAADWFGDTVALRYDVVGVDPRGVGMHSRMVCETSAAAPEVRTTFPITERESRSTWRVGRYYKRACDEGPNAIVEHMSTADAARDLDLLRQAIGEPTLNYYGASYGTYLGAVYAAMFPEHVGRFVVDGVLDPVQLATGDANTAAQPFSTRIKSARGSYEALTSALTECDRVGTRRCAFAGDAVGKWRQLVRLAKRGRLALGGEELRYDELVSITLATLYDNRTYSWLEYFLSMVYENNVHGSRASAPARPRGLTLSSLRRRAAAVMRAPYSLPAVLASQETVDAAQPFYGITCADSLNPSGRAAWWAAGRAQDAEFPWFGSLWTWMSAGCSGWSTQAQDDAFLGPFEATPANPILVIGNTHDPATPVQGARRFTTMFEGSRFLLVDGWGHGALFNTCVTAAFDDYFDNGSLPREGSVCEPDRRLF